MVERPGQRHICVIYTGGTIGMRAIDPELHPGEPAMLGMDEVASAIAERCDVDLRFTFEPLLDDDGEPSRPLVSSEIGPRHWRQIALTVKRHYDAYDGFVILHGTDTMAWTASALSFMFGNLAKPVVLTGSQRPISAAPSDALPNFVGAVMLAARTDDAIPLIPEVVICFGDLVLRGNRSTKTSAASLQGFDTPNAPRLGRVGRRFDLEPEQVRRPPASKDGLYVRTQIETRVADVVLYPGISAQTVQAVLRGQAGAVLRTFGAGNAAGGAAVREVLRAAAQAGTVMVNVTQAHEGTVEAGMLTGSRALTDCGVLSGVDMTPEAALTKLMVLLGSEAPAVAAEQVQLDHCGEQSMDVVELQASAAAPDQDGVWRLILSTALHARARPDKVVTAVLRLTAVFPSDHDESGSMAVVLYFRHWGAGRGTDPDARSAGTGVLGRGGGGGGREVVVDVTAVCQQVLVPGAPVTLTVVPTLPEEFSSHGVGVRAVLTLFVERLVTDIA